jgi:hypothetical protein
MTPGRGELGKFLPGAIGVVDGRRAHMAMNFS